MSDFWHGLAKFGEGAAKFMADNIDRSYREIDRRLENGEYERVSPEQMSAYLKYDPKATAALRAAGKRWGEWGRGERD